MNFDKTAIKIGLAMMFCLLLSTALQPNTLHASSISNLVTFDNSTDLVTFFNDDTSPQFTNVATEGISNTGAIDVPTGSSDIWTTKQGYSVAGMGDKYTFSAFFKIKENAGYGGLGFSSAEANSTNYYGSPEKGVGVFFHGGGGAFVNNRENTLLDWYETTGDLVLGNWYKMIFKVTAKGSNTYELNLQIWNSNENGVLGTLFTEQSVTDVVNADIGSASIIHGYFSASGWRMEKIDNFLINLEGGATFVEAGLPVVLTTSVTDITTTSFNTGGNVTDEQGAEVSYKGVCWSTSVSPTISDNDCTNNGSGIGSFNVSISPLSSGTTYHVRAYATNSEGTSYGSEIVFETDEVPATPTPTPTARIIATPKPTSSYSNIVAATPTPTPTITVEITPTETPTPTTVPSTGIIQLLVLGLDGQPVKNTVFTIGSLEYKTDGAGKVDIRNLSKGTHTISIKINGYSYSQDFIFGAQTSDLLTVRITKDSPIWASRVVGLFILLAIILFAILISKKRSKEQNNLLKL